MYRRNAYVFDLISRVPTAGRERSALETAFDQLTDYSLIDRMTQEGCQKQ
jgi:hypothetical protein